MQSSVIIKYMKRVGVFFLLITSIFVVRQAYADSSSTVIINNSVDSSSSTTSNSNCHTTVHKEVNGHVEDYDSDNCGDVNMDDGNNSVHISNNSAGSADTTSTPTPTSSDSKYTPTPTEHTALHTLLHISPKPTHEEDVSKEATKAAERMKDMQQQQRSFFRRLQDFFKNLFPFL